MAVTAPFLKKPNAALKLLTKKFVSNFIQKNPLHAGENLMLGHADKDGQT